MESTLYQQFVNLEEIQQGFEKLEYSGFDVSAVQKNLLRKFEKNPVLIDALERRKSIEESVYELSEINKGIKKFLPHKVNKPHNQRIEQIGELISEPSHLETNGIFALDNLVTGVLGIAVASFGASYFISKFLSHPDPNLNPEELQQYLHTTRVVLPLTSSALYSPIIGFALNLNRFNKNSSIDEAKYLDKKIEELSK